MKVFVYLASLLTKNGKCKGDIGRRVKAGDRVNEALFAFVGNHNLSRKVGLAVHSGVLLVECGRKSMNVTLFPCFMNAVKIRAFRTVCAVLVLRDIAEQCNKSVVV